MIIVRNKLAKATANDYHINMADQDDLLLLHHLRAHASGCRLRMKHSHEALAEDPGRAAARITSWALGRSVAQIQRHARRGWRFGQNLAPNAQEARFLEMVRALSVGDHVAAEQAALWLVPSRDVDVLLDRAAPLAGFYAVPLAPRRAAHA